MGFHTGAYAKVWDVSPVSDTNTKLRISISKKNKKTGEYDQDFSGFVLCIGTANAKKAAKLRSGARIKIGDCDVSTTYFPEKKVEYTNFKIFSFEEADGKESSTEPEVSVDSGEVEDKRLPF